MIWVTTDESAKSLKVFTRMTFSCQRRVAQRLMDARGAYRVTGTHTSRAVLRRSLAAIPVFLKLRGLPSVITMTMDFASLRPYPSSDFAVIRAKEVRVLPWGQVRPAIW